MGFLQDRIVAARRSTSVFLTLYCLTQCVNMVYAATVRPKPRKLRVLPLLDHGSQSIV